MEISNEIKFKVALQYYGQPFLVCYNIENKPVIETFSGKNIEEGMYEPDVQNKRELLILKSPFKNTELDKEFFQLLKEAESTSEDTLLKYNGIVGNIESSTDRFAMSMFHNSSVMYQYCISKGIDLPNYLLGGKTLKEAGMAIYENEMD